jgi:hypothetical protein
MKIKTKWKKIKLASGREVRRRNKETGGWTYKTHWHTKVREGDAIIVQMRLENYYFKFVKDNAKSIGNFVLAKDKVELDTCEYCYIYITHKTKLILRKLWVDEFKYEKTTTEKLSNRTIELNWYSIHFSKSEQVKLDTINGIYTDVNYAFSGDIESECISLSTEQTKERILNAVKSKQIGRGKNKDKETGLSKRRKLGQTTFNYMGWRTIKENVVNSIE